MLGSVVVRSSSRAGVGLRPRLQPLSCLCAPARPPSLPFTLSPNSSSLGPGGAPKVLLKLWPVQFNTLARFPGIDASPSFRSVLGPTSSLAAQSQQQQGLSLQFQLGMLENKKQRTMSAASETSAPQQAPASKLRLGTHSGTFHCDEALGCFIIRLTDQFRDAEIVRTRKQEILNSLDAILDVGGEYDPARHRYDHHQKGFDQCFGHGFTTKLSSAGLVYKHFGREVIAKVMGVPVEHKDVETVYIAVYKNFIEAVDAIDNGINQFPTDAPPLYQNNTHLAARVGRFNPDWMEESSEEKELLAFHKAMSLAGEEFLESVNYISKSWLPARSIVADSLAGAVEVDPSGQIVLLKSYCPWKQHLSELEKDLNISLDKLPIYVVYEDEREHKWRVQAVSVTPGSFQSRLPLPEAWRGLRDEELSQVSGIPGCIFVHISGFIGGNATKEGALKMAKKALHGSCSTQGRNS